MTERDDRFYEIYKNPVLFEAAEGLSVALDDEEWTTADDLLSMLDEINETLDDTTLSYGLALAKIRKTIKEWGFRE